MRKQQVSSRRLPHTLSRLVDFAVRKDVGFLAAVLVLGAYMISHHRFV